jgi:hypothetical protein
VTDENTAQPRFMTDEFFATVFSKNNRTVARVYTPKGEAWSIQTQSGELVTLLCPEDYSNYLKWLDERPLFKALT